MDATCVFHLKNKSDFNIGQIFNLSSILFLGGLDLPSVMLNLYSRSTEWLDLRLAYYKNK
jgi:hypothetical protein